MRNPNPLLAEVAVDDPLGVRVLEEPPAAVPDDVVPRVGGGLVPPQLAGPGEGDGEWRWWCGGGDDGGGNPPPNDGPKCAGNVVSLPSGPPGRSARRAGRQKGGVVVVVAMGVVGDDGDCRSGCGYWYRFGADVATAAPLVCQLSNGGSLG